MHQNSTNTLPVPHCWLKSYNDIVRKAYLSRFPTRAYLDTRPEKAELFCRWVKRQLSLPPFRQCKGLLESPCPTCEKSGIDNYTALSTLSRIVSKADPDLSKQLKEQAEEIPIYQERSTPRQNKPKKLRPPSNGLQGPGPVAKAMHVPKPPVFTNAVAKAVNKGGED